MVAEDKLTVLLVTHDRDLAARFADRTIQMRDGKIEVMSNSNE
jgi:ABC-type sulfate/molybdate transport systems ATPase subunit